MTAEDICAFLPFLGVRGVAGLYLHAVVFVRSGQKICSRLSRHRKCSPDAAVAVEGTAAAALYFDLLKQFRIDKDADKLIAGGCGVVLPKAVHQIGDLIGLGTANTDAAEHNAGGRFHIDVRNVEECIRKGLRHGFLNILGLNDRNGRGRLRKRLCGTRSGDYNRIQFLICGRFRPETARQCGKQGGSKRKLQLLRHRR